MSGDYGERPDAAGICLVNTMQDATVRPLNSLIDRCRAPRLLLWRKWLNGVGSWSDVRAERHGWVSWWSQKEMINWDRMIWSQKFPNIDQPETAHHSTNVEDWIIHGLIHLKNELGWRVYSDPELVHRQIRWWANVRKAKCIWHTWCFGTTRIRNKEPTDSFTSPRTGRQQAFAQPREYWSSSW